MTPIEKLLSQSALGKRELKRQDLIVSVTEQIWAAMEAASMSKADLARALETSKSNITQLLSGDRNMTLATLADISAALKLNPSIYLAEPSHRTISVSQRVFDVAHYVEKGRQTIVLNSSLGSAPYRRFTTNDVSAVCTPISLTA